MLVRKRMDEIMQNTKMTADEWLANERPVDFFYIAYIFPPRSSGGTQRSLQQVKCLSELGNKVCVLSAENYEKGIQYDQTLCDKIPKDVDIYRVPDFTFARQMATNRNKSQKTYGIRTKAKQLLMDAIHVLPDRFVFWAMRATLFCLCNTNVKRRIERSQIIYVSLMPFSSSIVAYILAMVFRKKLIIEYRDSFVDCPYTRKKTFPTNRMFDSWIEKRILRRADLVISATPGISKSLIKRGAVDKNKVHVATNGYDSEGYEQKKLNALMTFDKKLFVIRYLGRLYDGQDISMLLKCISGFRMEGFVDETNFRLEFYGAKLPEYVEALIAELGISSLVVQKGYVSYDKSIELQKNSDALLLVEYNSEVYTSKLFEYLAAKKPIFAMVSPNTELETILKRAGHRHVCDGYQKKQIESMLKKLLLEYRMGDKWQPCDLEIEKYSRMNITKEILEKCKKMLNEPSIPVCKTEN